MHTDLSYSYAIVHILESSLALRHHCNRHSNRPLISTSSCACKMSVSIQYYYGLSMKYDRLPIPLLWSFQLYLELRAVLPEQE